MNAPTSQKLLTGLDALANAIKTVTKASLPPAGQQEVQTQRIKFEAEIQEARNAFGEYFAELDVTPGTQGPIPADPEPAAKITDHEFKPAFLNQDQCRTCGEPKELHQT